MSDKIVVFVYGSLRSGYWNHRFLRTASFLGAAETLEPFELWIENNGSIPTAVPSESGAPLKGEVYEVDATTFDTLNVLESGYRSGKFPVMIQNGDLVEAIIYHVKKPLDIKYRSGGVKRIMSGDYTDAVAKQTR